MCPQKKEEEEAARKKKEQEEVEAWDKAEKEAEEAAKASGAGFNARCDTALLAMLLSCCSGPSANKVRCGTNPLSETSTLSCHIDDGCVWDSCRESMSYKAAIAARKGRTTTEDVFGETVKGKGKTPPLPGAGKKKGP